MAITISFDPTTTSLGKVIRTKWTQRNRQQAQEQIPNEQEIQILSGLYSKRPVILDMALCSNVIFMFPTFPELKKTMLIEYEGSTANISQNISPA